MIPSDLGRKGTALGGTWSAISDAGEATNLNLVHMKGYDALNVRDLTAAEIEGRAQTPHAMAALRHTLPGFEGVKLRNFGMVRSRRKKRVNIYVCPTV